MKRIDLQILISNKVLDNNIALLTSIWYEDIRFECDILKKCSGKLKDISVKLHSMIAYEAEILEALEGKIEGKIENQDANFAIKALHDNFK